MTHKIYFIIISLLLLPVIGKAQLNQELLPNGGFEQYAQSATPPSSGDFDPYQKPLYWYINRQLGYSRVKDAHGGQFAVKLYPNGHSFYSRDKDFNINCISINGKGEYKLSYWYKGKAKKSNVIVIVDWYNGNKLVRKDRLTDEKVKSFSDNWEQKTIMLTAPASVNKAGLAFELEYDSSVEDGYIIFDDISFLQTKEGEKESTLTPPTGIKAKIQQREAELSWNAVSETGVSYEIHCNDKVIDRTEDISYVVEKLFPNTKYRFTVITIKGDEISKSSEPITATTLPMFEKADNDGRIPYLYTIKEDGTCPRTLRLYYNDLADPNARISYKIDGGSVLPQGSSITFPSKGMHILEIEIEETSDRKWEIEYKLNVE